MQNYADALEKTINNEQNAQYSIQLQQQKTQIMIPAAFSLYTSYNKGCAYA